MLVILKNKENLSEAKKPYFSQGGIYRHVKLDDENHMVYGVIFNKKAFENSFVDYAPIIKERVLKTAFVDNGKVVTKSDFNKNIADVHKYGKSLVVYVGGHGNIFAIRIPQATTKKDALAFAYEVMLELFQGDLRHIDLGYVTWLYRGIPLTNSFNYNSDAQYRDLTYYENWTK